MAFELDGRPYLALNGGPEFRFTEAISLVRNEVVHPSNLGPFIHVVRNAETVADAYRLFLLGPTFVAERGAVVKSAPAVKLVFQMVPLVTWPSKSRRRT